MLKSRERRSNVSLKSSCCNVLQFVVGRLAKNLEKSRPAGPDQSEPAISGDHPASSSLRRLRGRDVNCGNAHGTVAVGGDAQSRGTTINARPRTRVSVGAYHTRTGTEHARGWTRPAVERRDSRAWKPLTWNADYTRPHFCVERDSMNSRVCETQRSNRRTGRRPSRSRVVSVT